MTKMYSRGGRTTDQMFAPVVRDLAAQERAQREDQRERERRAAEAEARLDAPLTRRELLEAIETTASDYGCAGTPESDAIADAFRKLGEALS